MSIAPCIDAELDTNSTETRLGYELALICRSCGNRWAVEPEPDGQFSSGFWRCPRGCDS